METAAAADVETHAPVVEPPPAQSTTSFLGLARNLIPGGQTVLRQRLQVAQVKLLERVKRLGRDAIRAGIGGLAVFIGSTVLLIGLGLLAGLFGGLMFRRRCRHA